MMDFLRHILYPTALLFSIATVAVNGWSSRLDQTARHGFYPALNPQLMHQVLDNTDAYAESH